MKKYEQVIAWIQNKIASEGLVKGDRLPGEIAMSETLGVSRQTVRLAISRLEEQGILSSVQGSGIYVGERPTRAERKHYGRIAVISTFFDDYIFPGTIRGMQDVFSKSGYQVQLSVTNNQIAQEREILKELLKKNDVDGILAEAVKAALPSPNLDLYRALEKKGIKILFFNTYYPELDYPCVRIDDVQSARDAVRLLINVGHRKIAGAFKSDDGQGRLRYEGYIKALEEAGIEPEDKRVIWFDSATYKGFSEIEDYVLRRMDDSTAVLCYNDELAYSLIESCLKRGMNIPEDFSVVGIDDSYLAQICHVPITSFAHPKEGLGYEAARKIVEMIETGSSGESLIIKTNAKIRSSIAPYKGNS